MTHANDPLERRTDDLLERFGKAELSPPDSLVDDVMRSARRHRNGVVRDLWRLFMTAAAAAVLAVTGLGFAAELQPVLDRVGGRLQTSLDTVRGIPDHLAGELRTLLERQNVWQ